MDKGLTVDDLREERLSLYYQRQTQALIRKDASEAAVHAAASLIHNPRLPRSAVEFRLDDPLVPGRWAPAEGLGMAIEKYVWRLRELERVRFSHSLIGGLTREHQDAYAAVVEAASALEALGWPVNWEQNLQAILEQTEFGLRGGKLVDRFQALPERVTLGDELLLMGTVTFYRQDRSPEGVAKPFKPLVLSVSNAGLYEATPLFLSGGGQGVPSRFRYASEWLAGGSGKSFRIAV